MPYFRRGGTHAIRTAMHAACMGPDAVVVSIIDYSSVSPTRTHAIVFNNACMHARRITAGLPIQLTAAAGGRYGCGQTKCSVDSF